MRKHFISYSINRFYLLIIFLFISEYELKAQLSYKVLFLGNSYTSVNNLPQIIHDVALSTGDTLIFDSNIPGGFKLIDHSLDITSQNKIAAGGWDYVVIQGQSEEPITFNNDFNNGGIDLFNMIRQYNPCAVTMPYMTWGRKNGDAAYCPTFPVICTYEGMDSTIRNCYLNLTSFINGEVSPVSVVWNFIRQNYPAIELYQSDESHPSASGSYAAACTFYSMIFKKDPTLITYDFGLSASDASIIKNVTKTIVFDSLQLWDFKKAPTSGFSYQTGSGFNEINFHPRNQGTIQNYFWDFGDGDTSSILNPSHSYLTNGMYTVSLTTTTCDQQGLHSSNTDTIIQFCNHTPTIYTSHSWLCRYDTLWTEPADSYQWFAYENLLPETSQYLPDYIRYNISGFEVISTINGCSELSELFTESPQWSGYYFDGIGDPCAGDTVIFAVLHSNGTLSGSENILWYVNDTLLPSMTNEDTLKIFSSGKFECKVINPTSDCPFDTTSSVLEYNCNVVGINEKGQKLFPKIYPNPATEKITVNCTEDHDQIYIYNLLNVLIKTVSTSIGENEINVSDLAKGIYYIKFKKQRTSLRFITN